MWNSRKLICGLARKCTSSPGNINPSSITSKKEFHRKYEPEYLDSKEPQVPVYDLLNIKIRSYDFTILENFSGYIHKTAENMGIEVTECWGVPCQKHEIHTYKHASMQIESRYSLNTYERNVQLADLPSTKAPIFFNIIQTALPEGVRLNIDQHTEEDELIRYVPDLQLNELKNALVDLGGPSKLSASRKK